MNRDQKKERDAELIHAASRTPVEKLCSQFDLSGVHVINILRKAGVKPLKLRAVKVPERWASVDWKMTDQSIGEAMGIEHRQQVNAARKRYAPEPLKSSNARGGNAHPGKRGPAKKIWLAGVKSAQAREKNRHLPKRTREMLDT